MLETLNMLEEAVVTSRRKVFCSIQPVPGQNCEALTLTISNMITTPAQPLIAIEDRDKLQAAIDKLAEVKSVAARCAWMPQPANENLWIEAKLIATMPRRIHCLAARDLT